jgi:D-cysteine desulfhydrase family pyridoxal phosphate-dependent enzyme
MVKELPRVPLAHLPTPIEELPHISAALGGPRLLVKRDDQTGLAFGGNKTRKLEYLVADAQAQGAVTLITAGAIQSNHCRQTVAAAARCGLDCILVLAGESPDMYSSNTLLDRLLGAELVWTAREKMAEDLQATYERAATEGREPYLIPYGGSNPIGAAAYAFAMREFIEQGVEVDWIVFASSSGGTQAGMQVGARLFGFTGKLLGISVDKNFPEFGEQIAELATETAELLGEQELFTPFDILVNDDYLGGGYAVMGVPEREAIQLFARHEGLLLDPVYTGRAAAGMIDLIHAGLLSKEQTVLFWHTGGTPALFAERYQGELLEE